MSYTTEYLHPVPVTEDDAYRALAMAVLVGLVEDLQSPNPLRRNQGRASLEAHVPELWLDLLCLSDAARARVEALLHALA